MNAQKTPKISLVGAGPGDVELLTLKAIKAIRNADVVLYDALANDDILKFAPTTSKKVYVGKRADNHAYTQDEINILMIQYAFSHGHVVRLKGGDAFVFGRGHEEMSFAQSLGIHVEIIPGISSCIAVPEMQEIPLTRRNISESFWVTTATTRTGELSNDIKLAAQSTATIVILMGMKKLKEIVAVFSAIGKDNLPIMIVQNGTTKHERVALGEINNIEAEVNRLAIASPATIVIGEVVRFHKQYKSKNENEEATVFAMNLEK